MSEIVRFNQVEDRLINIRNQNVLLDSDVAFLYGVETKRVNDAVKSINIIHDGNGTISAEDLEGLKAIFKLFIEDILGLTSEESDSSSNEAYKKAIDLLLSIRQESKLKKDWETADKIRKQLAEFGFEIKDGKDGVEWTLNK